MNTSTRSTSLGPSTNLSTNPSGEAAASHDPDRLRQAYSQARRQAAARHRDIAAGLGVSEGELIAAHTATPEAACSRAAAAAAPDALHGLHARRLGGPWPRVLAALEQVGEVMALTRNDSCVHEKTGSYLSPSASGPDGREMGLVLGPDIDLRIFYSQWAHGFSVTETTAKGVQRSLQFFDATGTAVHKVFVKPATDLQAWIALTLRFAAADQSPGMRVQSAPVPAAIKPDAEVDLTAFHQDWASLRDTHEFFGLLRRHGLGRTQALRLAEPRFVQPVDVASAQQVLSGAAALGTPVMVFVGNPGMIQIHTGPVAKVEVMGPWLNVLDPHFNLHLREDHIAAAWVVRKPTSDGLVTSLELFDAQGQTIAMLFGERKPGRAELCTWRELIDGLIGDREQTPRAAGSVPCLA